MSRLLDPEIEALSSVFRAFGDPLRLRAYALIQTGPQDAGTLAKALGVSPARLSPHLRQLIAAGFIGAQRLGRHRVFTLRHRAVCDLLAQGRRVAHEAPALSRRAA